jgi:hypothetical protein
VITAQYKVNSSWRATPNWLISLTTWAIKMKQKPEFFEQCTLYPFLRKMKNLILGYFLKQITYS